MFHEDFRCWRSFTSRKHQEIVVMTEVEESWNTRSADWQAAARIGYDFGTTFSIGICRIRSGIFLKSLWFYPGEEDGFAVGSSRQLPTPSPMQPILSRIRPPKLLAMLMRQLPTRSHLWQIQPLGTWTLTKSSMSTVCLKWFLGLYFYRTNRHRFNMKWSKRRKLCGVLRLFFWIFWSCLLLFTEATGIQRVTIAAIAVWKFPKTSTDTVDEMTSGGSGEVTSSKSSLRKCESKDMEQFLFTWTVGWWIFWKLVMFIKWTHAWGDRHSGGCGEHLDPWLQWFQCRLSQPRFTFHFRGYKWIPHELWLLGFGESRNWLGGEVDVAKVDWTFLFWVIKPLPLSQTL